MNPKQSSRGKVKSDELLNVNQWRAIQRFGGGKVAASKARQVAMQRLKDITGKDVAFDNMFACDDRPPPDPDLSADPLFAGSARSPPAWSGRDPPAPEGHSPSSTGTGPRGPAGGSRPSSPLGNGSPEEGKDLWTGGITAAPQASGTTSPSPASRDRIRKLPDYGFETNADRLSSGLESPVADAPLGDEETEMYSETGASQADASPEHSPPLMLGGKAGSIPRRRRALVKGRISGEPPALDSALALGLAGSPMAPESLVAGGRSPQRRSPSPPWRGSGTPCTPKVSDAVPSRPRSAPRAGGYRGHTLRRSQAREETKAGVSASSEAYYKLWRSGRADPRTPAWKHSQPQSEGPMRPLEVVQFSFDEAHPAVAEEHYKRTPEQNRAIEADRKAKELKAQKLRLKMEREASVEAASRSGSRHTSRMGSAYARSRNTSVAGAGSFSSIPETTAELDAQSRALQCRARRVLSAGSRPSGALEKPSLWKDMMKRLQGSPQAMGRPLKPDAADRFEEGAECREQSPRAEESMSPTIQVGRRRREGPGNPSWAESSLADHTAEAQRQSSFPRWNADGATLSADGEEMPPDWASREDGEEGRQTPSEPGAEAGGGRSLADHAAQAQRQASFSRWRPGEDTISSADEDEEAPSWTAGEVEVMVAAARFDPQRYEDYRRSVNEEMDDRRHRGLEQGDIASGYDSDLQREAQEEALAVEELEEELRRFPERRAVLDGEEKRQLQEDWMHQDEWMDRYRKDVGEAGGYLDPDAWGEANSAPGASASGGSRNQPDRSRTTLWHEQNNSTGSPGPSPSREPQERSADEQIGENLPEEFSFEDFKFVPHVQDEFPVYAIAEDRGSKSEGEQETLSPVYSPDYPKHPPSDEDSVVYWPLCIKEKQRRMKPHHRPKVPTKPDPFMFQHHSCLPVKSISASKLEADLILKEREEMTACNTRFRANPVPRSTSEPRYSIKTAEEEILRESNKEVARQWHKAIEEPFSFYYTDKLRQEVREEKVRELTDPNRFQKHFRAKDPPKHIYQDRYEKLVAEQAKKKQERAIRAEELLHESQMPQRMAESEIARAVGDRKGRARRDRHRPEHDCKAKHPSRPYGYTPNFDELHAKFEFEAAKTRARVRRGATVPQEFNLSCGNRKESSARRVRALEDKKKHIVDMLLDEDELPETRWPYLSPRRKVSPTVTPATRPRGPANVRETEASRARAATIRKAAQDGQFDGRDVKEAKRERARQEEERLRRQAKEHVMKKLREKRSERSAFEGEDFPADISHFATDQERGASGSGATVEEAPEDSSWGQPSQYVSARMKQAEHRAREQFQDMVLEQGINALRYIEEPDGLP